MTIQAGHVVVQAGGRGSRLRHFTWNKPKCLVSVDGKPLLYHLFERFPGARFTIIGDYLHEQLAAYLEVNPPGVECALVRASGKGTLGGVAEAVSRVPANESLLIVWSDLIVREMPPLPRSRKPIVCTTSAFTCRWTLSTQGSLHECPGSRDGIPGLFFFLKASLLPPPPDSGEFVRWFSQQVPEFDTLDVPGLEELGEFAAVEASNDRAGFARFFNNVVIRGDRVVKTVRDARYGDLQEKEITWYDEARALGFRRIPQLLDRSPLTLSRIDGRHFFEFGDLTRREASAVLADYLDTLAALHDKGSAPADVADVRAVYLDKTRDRVSSVARLIPKLDNAHLTINGRKCRNPFSERFGDMIEQLLPSLAPTTFVPIHGDPTYSNTLIDDKLRVWFIDPRGYFAKPGIFGDPWYDFAKVYYSAVGGYDAFNRRKFKLYMDEDTVEILMDTPPHLEIARRVFADHFGAEMARIEIIHGLIWLALSGYARDDVDSAIGAFFLGVYWLETGTSRL